MYGNVTTTDSNVLWQYLEWYYCHLGPDIKYGRREKCLPRTTSMSFVFLMMKHRTDDETFSIVQRNPRRKTTMNICFTAQGVGVSFWAHAYGINDSICTDQKDYRFLEKARKLWRELIALLTST